MRIVTYLPRLESIGGVERHVLETTRALARRGHQICLCYEEAGNLEPEFGSFCATMRSSAELRYSAAPARDARRILMAAYGAGSMRPDLIYTNNFSELAWAAAVRGLSEMPIVCHLHEFAPVRQVSMSVLGGRVSRFVVGSQFMREVWSEHGISPYRVDVVPEGLEPADYPRGAEPEMTERRAQLGLPDQAYVVLYLGRLIPEKGVDVLLDAWDRLALDPAQARLVIVGMPAEADGYVERLQAQAPAGCEWLPLQPDVVPLLQAADVVVLPSRWEEPFGRVVIEALATGRPAIAAAVGGIPEVLNGEFSAMLFPREDAGALADRLRWLRDWRRRDPELGERCAAHATRRYRLDATVSSLEEIFVSCGQGLTRT